MKVQLLIVAGAIASLLLLPSTAPTSSLFIEYIYTCEDNCYVVTDPVLRVISYAADDEIIPREEPIPNLPLMAPTRPNPQVDVTLALPICWHLDYGNIGDFDWNVIRSGLDLVHDVEIGQMKTVTVSDYVKPVPCYSATIEVRAPYVRDVYRVREGAKIALISILRPTDGSVRVYRQFERNVYCQGGAENATNPDGVCAAISRPFVGTGCAGGTDKFHPMDQPATNPNVETSTWGMIKSTYTN